MHRFGVGCDLAPFVDEALLRLSYLQPAVRAELSGEAIVWSSSPDVDPTEVERELTYLLYRAKIHAEGQAQRAALSRLAFGA